MKIELQCACGATAVLSADDNPVQLQVVTREAKAFRKIHKGCCDKCTCDVIRNTQGEVITRIVPKTCPQHGKKE